MAVPGAEVGHGAVEVIVVASQRPDAVALSSERLGLVGVRFDRAQRPVLVDAHGRAPDGDYDVRPGEVEAGGVLAKVFTI